MNSLLVLHLEFLQVDVTRGFRCLSRTREQQHAFNCPCAGLWMPVIPYRDSGGFARFSDLIFCIEFRIAFQAAELMATSQLAELIWESPGPWRWIQTFLPSKKISFYIVSYFLPNLACSRPLGTHTHTHMCTFAQISSTVAGTNFRFCQNLQIFPHCWSRGRPFRIRESVGYWSGFPHYEIQT